MMLDYKEFDTLFAVSKTGRILVVYIEVQQSTNSSYIFVHSSIYNGKIKTNKTIVSKGKNIGKSNATTHFEQAILEAESKFNKKKKEGYKTLFDLKLTDKEGGWFGNEINYFDRENFLKDAIGKYNTDHNNRLKPMLASKQHRKMKYPAYCQPKLNGVRCLAFYEEGKFRLFSREGEEYKVAHILDDLNHFGEDALKVWHVLNNTAITGIADKSLAPDRLVFLDGEIYEHGKPLQDIVHCVKTPNLETPNLSYYIYDIGTIAIPQEKRYTYLETLSKIYKDNKSLNFVYPHMTKQVNNLSEGLDMRDRFINNGYEGAIIRSTNANYEFSFRSKDLMKLKKDVSAEFEVIGVSLKDDRPAHDFVWVCKTPKGLNFEVKPHGTEKERTSYYNNYEEYIGKSLQLSFFEYTKDKIPFHITSVTIRDYE